MAENSKIQPALAWLGVCALAKKDGIKNLGETGDGVYRREFADWRVVLNASDKPMAPNDGGTTIEPFDVYLEKAGWPAGIIDPAGGVITNLGGASEDALIAAIEAELGQPIMEALDESRP